MDSARFPLAMTTMCWTILFAVLAGGSATDGSLLVYGGVALLPTAAMCWWLLHRGLKADQAYLDLPFWEAYADQSDKPWERVHLHFLNFRFLVPRNKLIFYTLIGFSLWGVAAIYVLKASIGDMGHITNLWVYGCIILACCGTSFVTEYSRQTSYLKLAQAQPFAPQFLKASILIGLAAVCLLLLVDETVRPNSLLLVPSIAVVLLSNTAFQVLGNALGQMNGAVTDEMLVLPELPPEDC